jgi:hypothetical protein
MRCRDLQGVAIAPFLGRFPFSALLRIAPYCVPGGVRVVLGGVDYASPIPLVQRASRTKVGPPVTGQIRARLLMLATLQ